MRRKSTPFKRQHMTRPSQIPPGYLFLCVTLLFNVALMIISFRRLRPLLKLPPSRSRSLTQWRNHQHQAAPLINLQKKKWQLTTTTTTTTLKTLMRWYNNL